MIPKIILLHPLIFQYLFHRGKWGVYLEELVAASLSSAALPIEQTLVGMTNALVALYNLKKPPPKIEEQKEAEEMQLPETPLTLKQH